MKTSNEVIYKNQAKKSPPLFFVYYNLGFGGLQKKIVDIVNWLSVNEPEIPTFVLLRRRKSDFDISWWIKNPKAKILYYEDWIRVRIPFFFPVFVLVMVAKYKPKTIFSFSDIPSLSVIWVKIILFWRSINVVVSERAYTSWYVSNQEYGKLRNFLVKTFYPLADKIVCLTKATKMDLISYYGLRSEKITIIPNWTSMAKEKPAIIRKQYDFIYIGRLDKAKRVLYLLQLFCKLYTYRKNVSLCILGKGEETLKIKKFIKAHNLNNNIFLKEPVYDVRPSLCSSKVLVLTTQYKAEGFPTAILEAMAMGIPVLTGRFAGLEDVVINGENGLIFVSEEDFIKKAILLLDNKKMYENISQNAKILVEKYHSLDNIKQYIDLAGI